MDDEVAVPTPATGQMWRSNAFGDRDPDGRVEVIGTVHDRRYGLIVVSCLIAGRSMQAEHVEDFLRRRTFVTSPSRPKAPQ